MWWVFRWQTCSLLDLLERSKSSPLGGRVSLTPIYLPGEIRWLKNKMCCHFRIFSHLIGRTKRWKRTTHWQFMFLTINVFENAVLWKSSKRVFTLKRKHSKASTPPSYCVYIALISLGTKNYSSPSNRLYYWLYVSFSIKLIYFKVKDPLWAQEVMYFV